jgi:hypothetical protein
MTVRLCNHENVQCWELSQPAGAYLPEATILGDAVRLVAGFGNRIGTVKLSGPTLHDDGTLCLLVYVSVDE